MCSHAWELLSYLRLWGAGSLDEANALLAERTEDGHEGIQVQWYNEKEDRQRLYKVRRGDGAEMPKATKKGGSMEIRTLNRGGTTTKN